MECPRFTLIFGRKCPGKSLLLSPNFRVLQPTRLHQELSHRGGRQQKDLDDWSFLAFKPILDEVPPLRSDKDREKFDDFTCTGEIQLRHSRPQVLELRLPT